MIRRASSREPKTDPLVIYVTKRLHTFREENAKRCFSGNSGPEQKGHPGTAGRPEAHAEWCGGELSHKPARRIEAHQDSESVRIGGGSPERSRTILRSEAGQAQRGVRLDRAVPNTLRRAVRCIGTLKGRNISWPNRNGIRQTERAKTQDR